jgi:succinate dehydrogenase/fumarate reductase cytochrome b subunit (b558 family)
MATTTIRKGQPGGRAWFRDSFVLHKLHSLSGVFPIGVFLVQHLLANSYSLRGEAEFNAVAKVIGYLPFVAVVEIGLIFAPLLFHSVYGFFITAEMRANVGVYQYGRNWLYWLQRISGIAAFVYIGYHVYSTTIMRRIYEFQNPGALGHDLGYAAISYDAMAWRLADPVYLSVYIIGIGMSVFHFANGLFNFGIRWGITIGAKAQKVSAYLWSGLGAALFVIGVWTAVNFSVQGQPLRAQYKTFDQIVRAADTPVSAQPGATPEPPAAPASGGAR